MGVTSEHWGFDMFQILTEILKETEPGPSSSWLVCDHLFQLLKEFEHYFPNAKHSWTGKQCVCDPFANKPGESTLSVVREDHLLETVNDDLKNTFETISNLCVFWIKGRISWDCHKALKSLLPYSTSYFWEAGFSAVTATKMWLQSRLDLNSTLQVLVSSITPKWDYLVAEKQAQGSHWFCSMVSCIIISLYNHNTIIKERQYTINVMSLNHLKTIPPSLVHGKTVFHETGP